MTHSSHHSSARQSARDERFNFMAFLVDSVSYFSVTALLSPYTILPLFASRLTDSKEMVSAIPMLASLAMTIPQILGARLVAHRHTYRPFLVRLVVIERLGVLLALVAMLLFARSRGLPLLVGPMLGLFIWWAAMGVNVPAFTAMMEASVSPERRGRLVGLGAAVGGLAGIAFAGVAGRLLESLEFPYGFVAVTAVAFALLVVGVIPLCLVREPPPLDHERRRTPRSPLAVLREDVAFRRFLVSQIVFALQAMPTGIFTTYAISRFRAGDADVAAITAVMTGTGAVAALAGGWLADHLGNRAVILWCTALAGVGAAAMWGAPTWTTYLLAFVPASFAMSAWGLANFSITMDFAPPGEVPSYAAAAALFAGPWRVAAPLAGGFLAARAGEGLVFALAGLGCLLALPLLAGVCEPRGRHAAPGVV